MTDFWPITNKASYRSIKRHEKYLSDAEKNLAKIEKIEWELNFVGKSDLRKYAEQEIISWTDRVEYLHTVYGDYDKIAKERGWI